MIWWLVVLYVLVGFDNYVKGGLKKEVVCMCGLYKKLFDCFLIVMK